MKTTHDHYHIVEIFYGTFSQHDSHFTGFLKGLDVRLLHFSTRSRVLSTLIECYRFISWEIIHFRGEKAT